MTIQDILMAWGKGKAMGAAENGYPSQAPFARFMLNPGDSAEKASFSPLLDPDQHCRVDAVVSEMRYRKPHHFEIICMAYIQRKRDAAIAKAKRESRSSIRNARENAEFWIDGRLGG